MGEKDKICGTEEIGSLKLRFFTGFGSLDVEAWRGTGMCRVTTYSKGIRRRTETRIDGKQWSELIAPVECSGYRSWNKRYDSSCICCPYVSWSFAAITGRGWYHSSGDGGYPEGFITMIQGLARFTSSLEGACIDSAAEFLSPFFGEA